jgi:hypothetical protein
MTSYFSNQKQLAHGQFEKEIDHTELSSHRRGRIIARLVEFVTPEAGFGTTLDTPLGY